MTTQRSLTAYLRDTAQATRRTVRAWVQSTKLLWQASPRYTLLSGALHGVQGVIPPLQIWLLKVLIDRVTAAVQTASSPVWSGWLWPAALILVSKVGGMWAQSFAQTIQGVLQMQVVLHARHLIARKTATLDMAFFENSEFYDQLAQARHEDYRLFNIPLLSLNILQQVVALFFTSSLLLQLHPAAVAVLFFTAVPYAILKSYFQTKEWDLMLSRTGGTRMVDYLFDQLLGIREIVKELRIFGLEPLLLQRFVEFRHKRIEEQALLNRQEVKATSLLSLLPAMGVVAVWAYAFARAAAGDITVGALALAFQAADQAQTGFRFLFQQTGYLYGNTLYLTGLFDYLNLSADAVEGALRRAEPAHPVPQPFQQGLEFCNVSFRYPGSEADVLKDVSFTLRSGETIAMVGENGAGKTTIVKLLARLYDPTEGTILLDGRDLRDYDLESYQKQIGVIFQDFVHYHLTARENVGFGQVDAMEDEAKILKAVERGGAQSLVQELPQGLDSMLGKTFEGGVDLSGGEWQKLALSRAFMRSGQLLILDEPTAALDPRAEHEIYERFARLTEDRTGVLVSHRFSTVRMADRIIVLHGGVITEDGTHEELMDLGGKYAELYTLQAERYQ